MRGESEYGDPCSDHRVGAGGHHDVAAVIGYNRYLDRGVPRRRLGDGVASQQLRGARAGVDLGETHDWGTDGQSASGGLSRERGLERGESGEGSGLVRSNGGGGQSNCVAAGVSCGRGDRLLLDCEVDDDGALVNRNNLNSVGWDAK